MIDKDPILIETAGARRRRLLASLVFGPIDDRRKVSHNLGRLLISAVLAALIGVICLGFSFVVFTLEKTQLDKTSADYANALRQGHKYDPNATVDEQTGYPIDPKTGWVKAPHDRFYDRQSGWEVNPKNGNLIDASTQREVDPKTGRALPKRKS